MRPSFAALAVIAAVASGAPASTAQPATLIFEAKIPLGSVNGRIDHLAFDPERQRLFVAELGNDTVGVVDLTERKVVARLTGLHEPQGLAWHAATETLYVANAGDGSVRLYRGAELSPITQIALGDDADNIRISPDGGRVVVGYGNGALAVIDPRSHAKVADIALKGHPESFQFDGRGSRIFANVPDARQIAVVDVASVRQISTWKTNDGRSNFPMAFDPGGQRVLAAFRNPRKLEAFAIEDGRVAASVDTCGDSDDVFVDAKRHRVYLSCGDGSIDVFADNGGGYQRLARLPTVSGARTSLFVPAADRLYLAVRATSSEPAAIWVLRPEP